MASCRNARSAIAPLIGKPQECGPDGHMGDGCRGMRDGGDGATETAEAPVATLAAPFSLTPSHTLGRCALTRGAINALAGP